VLYDNHLRRLHHEKNHTFPFFSLRVCDFGIYFCSFGIPVRDPKYLPYSVHGPMIIELGDDRDWSSHYPTRGFVQSHSVKEGLRRNCDKPRLFECHGERESSIDVEIEGCRFRRWLVAR
jgi:hypothetical protein